MGAHENGGTQTIMMDGEAVSWSRNRGDTLADILDGIIAGIKPDRTLTGVYLNGTTANRSEIMAIGPEEPFLLEIRTEPLEILLKEVLSDLMAHMDSLLVVFQEIGNNLRRGDLQSVFATPEGEEADGGIYMKGLEGMVAAQVLVEEVGRIERQSGQEPFRVSFIEETDRIESLLDGMLKAQEAHDWILLADLVEYEIIPLLQRGRIKTSRVLGEVQENERKGTLIVA